MKTSRRVLFAFSLLFWSCSGGESGVPGESVEDKAAAGRAKMRLAQITRSIETISTLPPSASSKAVAEACNSVSVSDLTDSLKHRCAGAHLASARDAFRKGLAVEGNTALARAASEGAAKSDIDALGKLRASAEAATAKRERDIHAAAGSIVRIAYGKTLRQQYLDNNLDIKVDVSGKHSDRITLRFALFNDVWANKIRKGDLIDQLKEAGFKRLDMTDGYDYHVYWDLK